MAVFTEKERERFFAKVDRAPVDNECWNWLAATDSHGYGYFSFRLRPHLAHRLAYRDAVRDIGSDVCLCHRCDNRLCVKPAHLFEGTRADNIADMRAKGREARGDAVANRGAKNGNSRLSEDDVREIRQRLADGEKQESVARHFGVSQVNVSSIARGKTWKSLV